MRLDTARRAEVIKDGVQTVHGVVLDIVKCHTFGSTMIRAFLDIDGIFGVPVLVGIIGKTIAPMMPWHEWLKKKNKSR